MLTLTLTIPLDWCRVGLGVVALTSLQVIVRCHQHGEPWAQSILGYTPSSSYSTDYHKLIGNVESQAQTQPAIS